MSNEIELYSKLQDPLQAIDRMGEFFAKSGMFGCDRVEQGKVLAMVCLAERKSPVQITRDYDIVEGKLRKKALAALADFRAAGGKHKWLKSGDEIEASEKDHAAELQLTDRDGNSVTYRYSMADARTEGLIKDKSRWVKRPGNMLRARCISNGLGMLCPEIFAGDDGEENDPTPGPALNLSTAQQPQPVTPPAAPTPPVIDVPAKVDSQEPTPPTPASTTPAQAAPVKPMLPAETVAKLAALIGDKEAKANAWFVKKRWLKEGEGFQLLAAGKAQKILDNSGGFLRAIGG